MSDLTQRLAARLAPWRRAEAALSPDDGPGYLPWIVGIMAFLAAVALASSLALSEAASRWIAGFAGTLTVEIAPVPDGDPAAAQARLNAAVTALRAMPEIARAEPIARERLAMLVAPWIGTATLDLPWPILVDVTLAEGVALDAAALQQRLATAGTSAVVDDHRGWLDGLRRLARLAVLLALVVVTLVGIASACMVVLATRAGLALQHDAIELLHLMGAHDSYIARQFARQALRRSALGAFCGVGAALVSFHVAAEAVHAIDPQLFATPSLGLEAWLLLIALPFAAAALATLAAWHTVMRALKRFL